MRLRASLNIADFLGLPAMIQAFLPGGWDGCSPASDASAVSTEIKFKSLLTYVPFEIY
jgi:hypothetical protein